MSHNHERELKKAAYVHLFSNTSQLVPGAVLEPQGKVIRDLQSGVLMTLVTFIASRDSRLHVSVWGLPYSEQFCFRPNEIARPEVFGTHPARVESRDSKDIYAWLDESGRYRVKLDVDREFSESGYSYLWVRLAKPYAGADHRLHAPLVQGTEVGIAFDGGDPDRPYISHAFHDSEHPDVVKRDNRSQNILRTPANNLLRMEDRRGEEHIATSTEYGKTQLNQGHIINVQEKPRGCGFELRTDEYGVIRVAKGLFVCADGQQKAVGEVLDMTTALREIDIALQQVEQLKLAATQAEALCADIGSQRRMFSERLKPLNELIHFSAPEGMAFSSGEHLQMAAAKNVAVNAGGDISAGATGSINLLAGQKAGLFARAGKLSVIAGQGALTVQAQNAKMKLVAAKKLSMSAESDILFAGKKRIVLTGGGSYLKLEDGKIEYGTEARYLRRTRKTYKAKTKAVPVSFPRMGTSHIYSAIYQLTDEHGNVLAGMPWLITPSGQVATGFSDEEGRTLPIYTRTAEEAELYIVQRKAQPQETLWFIGDSSDESFETEFREKR